MKKNKKKLNFNNLETIGYVAGVKRFLSPFSKFILSVRMDRPTRYGMIQGISSQDAVFLTVFQEHSHLHPQMNIIKAKF